jgi:hypothetical protein
MIKSGRMRWIGHVARIFVGKPEENNHYENQDVGGWTVLKWILEI